MRRSTVTITREGDRFVVTAHTTWDDNPLCFRSDDPAEALEAVEVFLYPGMRAYEVREDEDGTVWRKVSR